MKFDKCPKCSKKGYKLVSNSAIKNNKRMHKCKYCKYIGWEVPYYNR